MFSKARLRAAPRKFKNTFSLLAGHEAIVMQWATQGIVKRNWGDKLNPWLVNQLTGKNAIHRSDVYPIPNRPVHYWVGSHLATACSDPNAIVWGAGCISHTVPISGHPKRIGAVRGWLSHERLRQAGISVPRVVGDAALLLPRLYKPHLRLRRCNLGIVPHCHEKGESFFEKAKNWDSVRIIDITGGIEEVIEQIVACDQIASSSLHGLICADAYGVPSTWLKVTDKPRGDGFKFLDYFSSVGRKDTKPFEVTSETARDEIEQACSIYSISIDLDSLWNACPLFKTQ